MSCFLCGYVCSTTHVLLVIYVFICFVLLAKLVLSWSVGLCKLRCFPPVAIAWDNTSGLHIFPNLYTETIIVDSSPALWSSTRHSEKTTVLLLVRPNNRFFIMHYGGMTQYYRKVFIQYFLLP